MAILDIEPLHPELGARIRGLNRRKDLEGDNRCLIHRGAGYDADRFRRKVRRTRVRGSGPTLTDDSFIPHAYAR